jgi:hypothetical protein
MGSVQTALSNVVNLLKGTDPLQEEVDEAERQRRRTHLKTTQVHLREALRAELGIRSAQKRGTRIVIIRVYHFSPLYKLTRPRVDTAGGVVNTLRT